MQLISKKHISELIKLALPIFMGNIGIILVNAGDCFVAGRYSTNALAAVSIATSIHATVSMIGVGLLLSVSPLLSNIRGAGKQAKKYFYPTLKFAFLTSFILLGLALAYIPLLKYLGYEPMLLKDIKIYTFIVAFSSFGMILHVALKEFLQAYEVVFMPNFVMLLSVILNVILNFVFTFGLCGCPSMEAAGLALATLIARTLCGFCLLGFCLYKFNFENFSDKKYYKQIIKVGFPISVAIVIEFLSFNSMAILMGRISGIYAAAQNIIMTLANMSFMFPLAISNAIAVKVGFANGAKNYEELTSYIKNGVLITVGFMSMTSIIYATCSKYLASIFTPDTALISIIIPVMYFIAAFQVSDGVQVALAGVFKGLKRTKIVMYSNLIAYLMIGVSSGYYCALHSTRHLLAFWAAFSASSFLLSTILVISVLRILKKLKQAY